MVSTAAIVRRGDDILMIRDTAQGMLVLPGGHLRWTESVEAGLRREVREETGFEVEPTRLLEVVSSSSGLSDRGIIRVLWEATLVGGSERSSAEGTVAWVKLDDPELARARDGALVRRLENHPDVSGSTVPQP
jgi:ADP-ribose pyrophosphatase YjhB (NUDIX family)